MSKRKSETSSKEPRIDRIKRKKETPTISLEDAKEWIAKHFHRLSHKELIELSSAANLHTVQCSLYGIQNRVYPSIPNLNLLEWTESRMNEFRKRALHEEKRKAKEQQKQDSINKSLEYWNTHLLTADASLPILVFGVGKVGSMKKRLFVEQATICDLHFVSSSYPIPRHVARMQEISIRLTKPNVRLQDKKGVEISIDTQTLRVRLVPPYGYWSRGPTFLEASVKLSVLQFKIICPIRATLLLQSVRNILPWELFWIVAQYAEDSTRMKNFF